MMVSLVAIVFMSVLWFPGSDHPDVFSAAVPTRSLCEKRVEQFYDMIDKKNSAEVSENAVIGYGYAQCSIVQPANVMQGKDL